MQLCKNQVDCFNLYVNVWIAKCIQQHALFVEMPSFTAFWLGLWKTDLKPTSNRVARLDTLVKVSIKLTQISVCVIIKQHYAFIREKARRMLYGMVLYIRLQ